LTSKPNSYAAAGVNIAAGDDAVQRIKSSVASTMRPEVLSGLGGFGGLFALDTSKYRQPVLVSTTDGVGTKALVAEALQRYDTIGQDLVAMCVDDLVCCGAEPLFMLDYIAVGAMNPDVVEQLVGGIAEGCRQAGCALVGGEMAEHPDAMQADRFDLAGFAVGVVEREKMLDGSRVCEGDVLIGLASPGLRSNGYSLARRVLIGDDLAKLQQPAWPGADATLGDEMLKPSVIYAKRALAAIDSGAVNAIAHITGGGIPGNLPRVLPTDLGAVIERGSWEEPRIFTEIARLGDISQDEIDNVFNRGIGMILVVGSSQADQVCELVDGIRIGWVESGHGVRYVAAP
jgi:phosphoribosylformylglycinamidine cyclo-ligase